MTRFQLVFRRNGEVTRSEFHASSFENEPHIDGRLVVDGETHSILGAAILGTGGDEVIHCVLDLMYAGAPYTTLQRAMHIHPTVAELLPSLAAELAPAA